MKENKAERNFERHVQAPAGLNRTLSDDRQQTIAYEPNVLTIRLINTLLKTGLYGNSPRQVVTRLIDERLKQLIENRSPLLDERP